MTASALPRKFRVLGVAVSVTNYEEATDLIVRAGRERRPLTVSALAVHGLMTAALNPEFGRTLESFDLLTPDGQPVRWAMNRLGRCALKDRVYGPALMLRVCEEAARQGVGVYLFGSTGDTVRRLSEHLAARCPGLHIAGAQADRFRDATEEEDAADVRRILDSGAGIVFCGRGCPRQEVWCAKHRGRISAPLVAVGAAFDFHAGTVRQAPDCLQRMGLEWLFRLAQEPRRLWRRYLLLNPLFIVGILAQAVGIALFPRGDKEMNRA